MREKAYFQNKIKELQKVNPFLNSSDLAYEIIINEIVEGEIKIGDKIPQDDIALLLDMSRTPIRVALEKLEKDRFIEKSSKSGYKVRKPSFEEFYEFVNFRTMIESQAAYLAANNMNEEERKELSDTIKELNRVCDTGDMRVVFDTDARFHEIIVRGCHNRFLYQCFLSYQYTRKFYCEINAMYKDNIGRIRAKHNSIYEAIRRYDENAAKRAMVSHLNTNLYFFE